MASSGHTNAQRTAMQTTFTALATSVAAMTAAGNKTAAAANAADRQELQMVVTREQGAPLS